MHKQDVAVLLVSCLAVYLSLQHEGVVHFEPAWCVLHEANAVHHASEASLPLPVVADLNGDGSREVRQSVGLAVFHFCELDVVNAVRTQVVLATADAQVQVFAQAQPADSRRGFPPARLLSHVSLLPGHVRVATGRRPVALAVGPLDSAAPPANGTAAAVPTSRKSVIVLLTAGWSLLCFDHNLRLLWENPLGTDFPRSWAPREVAVLVISHALQTSDRGLIVVAASASRPEVGVGGDGMEDPLTQELAWEARLARGRHPGAIESDATTVGSSGVDARHHVNYYAFEGRTGALRWKHESADFHSPGDALADGLMPQHSYKLDAASLEGRHVGEAMCREYREAVIASLPHGWSSSADTRLRAAHWAKHTAREQGDSASAQGSATSAPNVVVAHLQDGLEAVHLSTGHTVCKLPLTRGGLHADLNADGVPDHVVATGWRSGATSHDQAPRCAAFVTSGSPGRPLFNGSVCRAVQQQVVTHGRHHWQSSGDPPGGMPIDLAPPATVAAYEASPAGGNPPRRRRWDVVFLNSRGDLTSFSPDGRRHFQLRTEAEWNAEGYTVPTLHTLLLRAGSTVPALLIAGEHTALLLSPAGSLLTRVALPGKPLAALQVVDLYGNGAAGLLARTDLGVFAYQQRQRPGTLPLAFMLGSLGVVLLAITAASGRADAGGLRSTDHVEEAQSRRDE